MIGSDSSTAKIKYRTCLRIENIPAARMTDLAFWSTLFSLWMGGAREESRVEVIYDVLLPWLAELKWTPAGLVKRSFIQVFASHREPFLEPPARFACLFSLMFTYCRRSKKQMMMKVLNGMLHPKLVLLIPVVFGMLFVILF